MHDPEMRGAKARDHAHERQHGPDAGRPARRLRADWRVWAAVVLMLGLILVYVFSDDLAFRGHRQVGPPVPAMGGR